MTSNPDEGYKKEIETSIKLGVFDARDKNKEIKMEEDQEVSE